MQPVARRRTVFFCNKLRSLATSLLFVVDPGNLPLCSNRFVPSISFPFFYNTHLLVVLFYTADPEASLFFFFFFFLSLDNYRGSKWIRLNRFPRAEQFVPNAMQSADRRVVVRSALKPLCIEKISFPEEKWSARNKGWD